MAIIIPDMAMPKSCEDCPFSSCKGRLNGFYCDVTTFDVDIESKERDTDCPLKSTDEMIAEIELQVFTDAYDGQFVGIEDVKQVINKYCKGDTNGT